MKRRHFLSIAGATASVRWAAPASALSRSRQASVPSGGRPLVDFSVDGLGLTPREYAADLASLAEASSIEVDSYSLGGTVAELEQQFAALLEKNGPSSFRRARSPTNWPSASWPGSTVGCSFRPTATSSTTVAIAQAS